MLEKFGGEWILAEFIIAHLEQSLFTKHIYNPLRHHSLGPSEGSLAA